MSDSKHKISASQSRMSHLVERSISSEKNLVDFDKKEDKKHKYLSQIDEVGDPALIIPQAVTE